MALTLQTGNVHTNVHLTNLAVKYRNADFKWSVLAPPLMVKRESDKFKKYEKAGYFKGAPIRADGAPAESVSLAYTYDTYTTKERAIKDLVTDRSIANTDNVFNLKQDTSSFLAEIIKIGMECDAADTLTTSGAISTSGPDHDVTPGNTWDDTTNSVPDEDILTGIRMVTQAISRKPNTILITTEIEEKLLRHPRIKEYVKYTMGDEFLKTGALPSKLFGLNLHVAGGIYNSAESGETVSMADIWGKHAVIAYVNPSDTVQFARCFIRKDRYMRVRTWRDNELEGDMIENTSNYVFEVVCSDAAYILRSCIA